MAILLVKMITVSGIWKEFFLFVALGKVLKKKKNHNLASLTSNKGIKKVTKRVLKQTQGKHKIIKPEINLFL